MRIGKGLCAGAFAAVVLLIGACSGGGDSDISGTQMSSIDDGTAETFIVNEVPDISGAKAEARAFVDAIEGVESVEMTTSSAREYLGMLSAITICIDESLSESEVVAEDVIQEIKARSLNTEGKISAYMELNRMMGNTVTSLDEIKGLASCTE